MTFTHSPMHMQGMRSALVAAGMATLLCASIAMPAGFALATDTTDAAAAPAESTESALAASDAPTTAESATTSTSAVSVNTFDLTSDTYTQWGIADAQHLNRGDYTSGATLLDAYGNPLSDTYLGMGNVYDYDQYNIVPGYFIVLNSDGINVCGCLDTTGTLFTDMAYDDFIGVDEHWILGVVVSEDGQDESSDQYSEYSSFDSKYHAIDHVDVYYDDAIVMTLDGATYSHYDEITSSDGYLLFGYDSESGDTNVDVYAPSGELINQIGDSAPALITFGQGYYYSPDGLITYHISGVEVGTADCPLTYDDVSQPYFVGNDNTIYDIYGEQIATISLDTSDDFSIYRIYPFNNGYAVFVGSDDSGMNIKCGIVDEDWEVVIQPEYDVLGDLDHSTLRYSAFTYGYCYAEKDGMFGYLATDGSVSAPLTNNAEDVVFQGDLFCVVRDANGGYRIVSAADGLLDTVYSDVSPSFYSSSPVMIVANADGLWGLADWRGNVIVDYAYNFEWDIHSDFDGSLVLVNSSDNTAGTYSAHVMQIEMAAGASDEASAASTPASETSTPASEANTPASEVDATAETPAGSTETPAETPEVSSSAETSTASTADTTSASTGSLGSSLMGAITAAANAATSATSKASEASQTDDSDSVLTPVEFADVTMSIPASWIANATGDDASMLYANDDATMMVAIYDLRDSIAIPEGTDYQSYFKQITDAFAAQYAGASVSTIDGEEGYAYGIEVPSTTGDDIYILVQTYFPSQSGGFTLVQAGYDLFGVTDDDVNLLGNILDSLATTSDEAQAAETTGVTGAAPTDQTSDASDLADSIASAMPSFSDIFTPAGK